ncbi:MAG TPA: ribosome biogenesis GTP-binding protein YihA/YsxC [Candidatus Moranbacteria bacterium]|nr:ribosome biogenesis GTP-binding protein YihA/YsxC [Candidatus Moranbacteria bacterium]
MQIKSAEFKIGAVGGESLPKDGFAQVAFVGRSNVGKSSLINSLTQRKELAISSSTPGRTQQLNFFLINEEAYFVDLPGYGYARVGLKRLEKIRRMIMWYLEDSGAPLSLVVLIVDASIGLKDFDREMLQLLGEKKLPFVVVANKSDKIKAKEKVKKMRALQEELAGTETIYFSAKTGKGREELLGRIGAAIS